MRRARKRREAGRETVQHRRRDLRMPELTAWGGQIKSGPASHDHCDHGPRSIDDAVNAIRSGGHDFLTADVDTSAGRAAGVEQGALWDEVACWRSCKASTRSTIF